VADVKTRVNDASVLAFLEGVKDDQKRRDCDTLIDMMRDVTGKEPRMWGSSIIGFGSYHYVYSSGRQGDWPVTGFSPRARNLSVYIMPGFSRYGALMERLGKHKTGKSCLYINQLADVDQDVLRQLVQASVEHMGEKYECT
jgi:hypothetical protein